MTKLAQQLNSLFNEAARIPGLFNAVLFSAVFVFFRDSLVMGFTGLGADLIRAIPDMFGPLAKQVGLMPAALLTLVKNRSVSPLISIRFLALTIHAANTLAMYAVSRKIFGLGPRTGLAAAAMFALSPVNTVAVLEPLTLGTELVVLITLCGALAYKALPENVIIYIFGGIALSCGVAGLLPFVLYPFLPVQTDTYCGPSDLKTGLKKLACWASILALVQAALLVFTLDMRGIADYLLRLANGSLHAALTTLWPPVSKLLFSPMAMPVRALCIILTAGVILAAGTALFRNPRRRAGFMACLAFSLVYFTGWTCGINPEVEVFSYYGLTAPVIWLTVMWVQDMAGQNGMSRAIKPVCAGLCGIFLIYSLLSFSSAKKVFFSETRYLQSVSALYPVTDNINRYAAEQICDGKTEQALQELSKAGGMPTSRKARTRTILLAGQANLLSGHYKKAEKYYRSALRRDPADINAAKGLAFVYKRKKLFGNAAAILDSCLALNPANPELLYSKGLVLMEAKNYAAAFTALASACTIDQSFCLFSN